MISNNTQKLVPFDNVLTNEKGFYRCYGTYDNKYHAIAMSWEDLQERMDEEIDQVNRNIVSSYRATIFNETWKNTFGDSTENYVATLSEYLMQDDPDAWQKCKDEGKLVDYVSIYDEKCVRWEFIPTEQDLMELEDIRRSIPDMGQDDLVDIYENHKSDNVKFQNYYLNNSLSEQVIQNYNDSLDVSETIIAMYEKQCELESLILDESEIITELYEKGIIDKEA